MRRAIGRLLLSILPLLVATPNPAQEQRVGHFVVNGLSCSSGACTISLAEFGMGRPLTISLSGAFPPSVPMDIYVEHRNAQRSKGVLLEYGGHSVTPGRSALRIPPSKLSALWSGRESLMLHLGDMNSTGTGQIVLHAKLPNRTEDYATVSIELAGLRAPNEELAWSNTAPMASKSPPYIPMYPNPVKSGLIHIDLQGMPYGRKGTLSILNMLGTPVYSVPVRGGDLVECRSEGLSKGIYFVRIEMEGTITRTGRLVVDR